jgi:type VI secretion system Hcp family effector
MIHNAGKYRTGCLLMVILAAGMIGPVAAAPNTIGYFSLPGPTDRCSTNIGHENQCPIFGMAQEVANSATQPGGAGKATFTFRISKAVDKATPLLLDAVASGKNYPNSVITLSQTGTSSGFIVTLQDIQITGVKQYPNADMGSPYGILEDVTFSFGKIRWQYSRILASWDLRTNKPTLAAQEGEAETSV